MRQKINLLLVVSALFLTMCQSYDEGVLVTPIDGLKCSYYIGSMEEGVNNSKGMDCHYTCPDKTVGPFDFEFGQPNSTKEDLDRRFCGGASLPPATQTPTSVSPTVQISHTPQPPLLTGSASMCDMRSRLINFRIMEPPPDLTGKTLEVKIGNQPSFCSVNPLNPTLLTCTIPRNMFFPASVLVSLEGRIVNDFVYSGSACFITTPRTPLPSTHSSPVPTLIPPTQIQPTRTPIPPTQSPPTLTPVPPTLTPIPPTSYP